MYDAEGGLLYVGKAKNLKRRVSSYFTRALERRIQLMVSQIARIEVTLTHTEGEALLLESNLIKSLKPRYNVLLRDDKSYPFIHLSTQDDFPRLSFHRGSRQGPGRFFGPYPNAVAVRETLHVLQKVFALRLCEDSVFRHRSRPCLQYQIKRCSGACVGLISPQDYARDVSRAARFLEGRGGEVIETLVEEMEAASNALEFERAARLRDQIELLRQIQLRQAVNGEKGDLDIIACAQEGGQWCVQVFFIRAGLNLGNRAYFPQAPDETDSKALLAAFLTQFYAEHEPPPELVLDVLPEEATLIESALSERAGRRVRLRVRVRAERERWLGLARDNARVALKAQLGSRAGYARRLEALREALGLEVLPQRMECFDISHTRGERAVASCVVFDESGPRNSEYRRFNIEGITPGDDYAAMRQAVSRRYARLSREEVPLPDLVFIDGGRGQLAMACEALEELGLVLPLLVGVSKGSDRRPGTEQLWLLDREHPVILPSDSPAMHLIAQIRDEAHRFAISAHRQRRAKARKTSVLEGISGVGPKRRQRLLKHFGGLRGLARAGVEDIAGVDGISRRLAQEIYDALQAEAAGR